MKPAIPLTDPRFRYTPSHKTDIRETFRRILGESADRAFENEMRTHERHDDENQRAD